MIEICIATCKEMYFTKFSNYQWFQAWGGRRSLVFKLFEPVSQRNRIIHNNACSVTLVCISERRAYPHIFISFLSSHIYCASPSDDSSSNTTAQTEPKTDCCKWEIWFINLKREWNPSLHQQLQCRMVVRVKNKQQSGLLVNAQTHWWKFKGLVLQNPEKKKKTKS